MALPGIGDKKAQAIIDGRPYQKPEDIMKVKGDLKVGSKVTIEYRMTAATIEVKDAKAKETKKK